MRFGKATEITLIIIVPLIIFLLLGELLFRLYLKNHIFYDVEMSRYALTLKEDSPNPKIGHHHRSNAVANLMGVTLKTNSDGFRDDDYAVDKGAAYRIMFLGDSLTLGWGVEKEQTFEHRLEQQLNAHTPTEIINLGVGNYNTTQELNLFIDKGLKYRPDKVVLFWFINDAEPIPEKASVPWLGHSRIITFFWSRLKALKARFSESVGFREYYSALYKDGNPGWEASKASLLRLRDLGMKNDFDFRVVVLPELHNLSDYQFKKEHALLMDFLNGNGIPALDLAPAFADQEDALALWVSLDDAHPNARAHGLIAERSIDFIRQNIHNDK